MKTPTLSREVSLNPSPLLSAGFGRKDVVEHLLQTGANVHARDDGGLIPLHNACSFGHSEVRESGLRSTSDCLYFCHELFNMFSSGMFLPPVRPALHLRSLSSLRLVETSVNSENSCKRASLDLVWLLAARQQHQLLPPSLYFLLISCCVK